jgi:nicotinamide-nucleotide amidase
MSPSDADLEALARRVAGALLSSRQTLATAESCTGGWIGKVCTDIPGSSAWFRGGAIVYDNSLKERVLGVRPATLEAAGAVSEPVVREMALGALATIGADASVAVSGVAGPDGGTPDKPVGTVWFAWATRRGERPVVRSAVHLLPGNREAVRRQAVAVALEGLLQS